MRRRTFIFVLLGLAILVGCGGGVATGPLAAPSSLKATAGAGQIVLTWQDNSTAEEGFRIFRKLQADGAFPAQALRAVDANIMTYTDSSASSADSYVYQVRAFAGSDEGEPSNDTPPVKPTLAANKVTLRILRVGAGQGVTTSTPPGISCINPTGGSGCSFDFDRGTRVVLRADSAENPPSVFSGFSGACTAAALTCELVMDAAKEVSATYAEAQPGITVQLSGDAGAGRVVDFTGPDVGGPYINCAGTASDCSEADYFNIGNTVVLYAEPSSDGVFTGWEGCDEVVAGRGLPNGRCNFVVKATNVITARFLKDRPAPEITSFTASPLVFNTTTGTDITLSWNIDAKGATDTTLELSDNFRTYTEEMKGKTLQDSVVIFVSSGEDRTFTLKAKNFFGEATDTKTVTKGSAPIIGTFTAEPTTVASGGSVTLKWTGVSSNVTKLTIDRDPGTNINVTGKTEEIVNPTVNTTYTLIAENPFGTTTFSPARAVTIGSLPSITFSSTPAATSGVVPVVQNTPVTLSWTVTGAATDGVKLNGTTVAATQSGFSVPTTAVGSTDYTLSASNAFGSAPSQKITVTVTAAPTPPVIENFAAKPTPASQEDTTFAVGGTASFSWGFAPGRDTPTGLTLFADGVAAPAACQPAPTGTSTSCAVTAETDFTLQVQPGGNTAGPVTILTGTKPETGEVAVTASATAGAYDLKWSPTGSGTLTYTLTRPDTPDPNDVLTVVPAPSGVLGEVVYTFTPAAVVTTPYRLTASNEFGDTPNIPGTGSDEFIIPPPTTE